MVISVGEKIRLCRRELGLTQQQLADALGVQVVSINRYERGARVPDTSVLPRLCAVLKCDIGWLLGQDEAAGQGTGETGLGIPVLRLLPEHCDAVPPSVVEGHLSFPGSPVDAYSVRVADDAMLPTIKAGDWVIFKAGDAEPGDLTVLRDEWGAPYVRRAREIDGKLAYVAENPDCAGVTGPRMTVVGKVVRVLREYSF